MTVGTMSTNATAAVELKRLRELAGLSVRRVAAALRESGSNIGQTPSSYVYYENEYKKTYLPVDLVDALVPILSGRGVPPIGEKDVLALGGFERGRSWVRRIEFDECPGFKEKVEIDAELLSQIIAGIRKDCEKLGFELTAEQEGQLIVEVCRRVAESGRARHPGFIEREIGQACRLAKAFRQ